MAVFVFSSIMASILLNRRDNKMLRECSTEVFAKITSLKKSRNKGYTARVLYKVDSAIFESYDYVGVNHPYKHGDQVLIQVACDDPKTIRILEKVN